MRLPPMPPEWAHVIQQGPHRFAEAMQDDRYRQLVRRCEAKYRHWAKARFVAREEGLDPELLWAMIAMGRQASFRTLRFTDKHGRPLMYTLPDRVQRELMRIDQQLAGRVAFAEQEPITEQDRERFIISALMEEAIASSMLEGAATTREVAKEMLRQDRKPRDRSERMVVNNYNAILFIRDNKRTPLTPQFLREVQAILTENTLDDPSAVGRFRRRSEQIRVVDQTNGELLHDPPHADELDGRVDRICAFANDTEQAADHFVHPAIKAILLHYQIAYDHPFVDGNGRTARAIFYWSMLRDDFWLFE